MWSRWRRKIAWRGLRALRRAGTRFRSPAVGKALFRLGHFAERPVNLAHMGDYKLERFPPSGPLPWLDEPDAESRIDRKLASGALTAREAEAFRHWTRSGYFVLERFFDPKRLDRVWEAYDRAARGGGIKLQPEPNRNPADPHPSRSLDAHFAIPDLAALLEDPSLHRWVQRLFGREPVAYQTLVSHKGSEQREHSDAIHMTTYPLGYLAAAWIAFEDIHPDCGPVVYYPGSHRLPYLSSLSLGISSDEFRRRGYDVYFERYEPAIQSLIAERGLVPETFLPRKGDVLVWHANLIHAGSPRRDLALSRKAAVLHYFVRGAVCYHDLAGELVPVERLF